MKTKTASKKGLYIGAGTGLVLFAIIGLLHGSFIGGVIGLNIAGSLFGLPVEPTVISRLIIGASMVLGIMVAGLVFVVGASLTGWVIGYAIDSSREAKVTGISAEGRSK